MNCGPDDTIPDWVIEHPETLAVFTAKGIDFSCGGNSLEYVCRQNGQDVAVVVSELRHVVEENRKHGDETPHRK